MSEHLADWTTACTTEVRTRTGRPGNTKLKAELVLRDPNPEAPADAFCWGRSQLYGTGSSGTFRGKAPVDVQLE